MVNLVIKYSNVVAAPLRASLCGLLFVALNVLPVAAQAGFEEGLAAAEKADYITALKNWQPLAAQGHASSQFNIALMYESGMGLPRDLAQALTWLQRAAESGYARAQNNLGVYYAQGKGVPKDDVKAAFWYRKAAEQAAQ